jgi:hypothetical protein
MFTYCVSIIVEVLLETLISKLLTQLWQWLREDERVQKLHGRLKLQILAWYLRMLLNTTKYPKN